MGSSDQFDYNEKRSPFARYGLAIGLVVLAVIGFVLVKQLLSGGSQAPRRQEEMVMVRALPPPPPPPPPPPQNEPKQQMEEQTQVTEQDMKPAEQPADATPELGTGITGSGAGDLFNLGGKDKNYVGGGGSGHGGGSRFGGYFTDVVRAVTDALSRNPATRNANFNIRVKVWSDVTGRITRVKLADSTGDTVVDDAIRNTALLGHQLPDMPEGMHMPIELRLNLRRPN